MKNKFYVLTSLAIRYRRYVLPVALGAVLLLVAGVSGVIYLTYKTGSYALSQVKTLQVTPSELAAESPSLGVVEETVMTIANTWVRYQLPSAGLVPLQKGLSCLDAIGGPSPQTMVSYIQTQINDPNLEGKMKRLSDAVTVNAVQGSPSDCIGWLLNS